MPHTIPLLVSIMCHHAAFFYTRSWPILADVLQEGLSLMVRHRPSNKIVGAIVANDLYLSHKNHPYDPASPPAIFPINDLIAEMDDLSIRRDFGERLRPKLVLRVTIGATLAEHFGKGVASRLRAAVCEHAHETKGFQYALLQTTNPVTEHIYLNKMGGKVITMIDPKMWSWKNKGDGLSQPYKDYEGGLISNILVQLPLHQEHNDI